MTITFAPVIPAVKSSNKLCCVALKWTDNPGIPLASVQNSGTATAANFKRLSGGAIMFDVTAHEISVPFAHNNNNVGPAVIDAKKQLAAQGFKEDGTISWVMVNNNAGKLSHTAGNTSYLLDALTTTFYHEVGRQPPTNLGSSGAYEGNPPVYMDQADGTTFMGHFASNELTACQLYGLGWLAPTQMAVYDLASGSQEFTIYGLNQAIGTSNLMSVMINDGVSAKPLFISRPTFHSGITSWALHLGDGPKYGGTERIKIFGHTATYQGLTFTEISNDGNTASIQISKAG